MNTFSAVRKNYSTALCSVSSSLSYPQIFSNPSNSLTSSFKWPLRIALNPSVVIQTPCLVICFLALFIVGSKIIEGLNSGRETAVLLHVLVHVSLDFNILFEPREEMPHFVVVINVDGFRLRSNWC